MTDHVNCPAEIIEDQCCDLSERVEQLEGQVEQLSAELHRVRITLLAHLVMSGDIQTRVPLGKIQAATAVKGAIRDYVKLELEGADGVRGVNHD